MIFILDTKEYLLLRHALIYCPDKQDDCQKLLDKMTKQFSEQVVDVSKNGE